MSEPVTVVGIGASAGGLTPIEGFFDALPSNTGASFVVVQHLSPHHESMMAPLLNSHTDMPVAQAEDGTLIQANCVYLIPPGTELELDGRKFVVRARSNEKGDIPKPIDIFFKSLAESYEVNAVGIVLSGTGSDGTEGVGAIRNVGGLTLAQDDTASFEGMPLAAQRSGNIDAIMDPTGLAAAVRAFIDDDTRPGDGGTGEGSSLDFGETRILSHLSQLSGITFDDYKPATIHRRLHRRIGLTGNQTIEDYETVVQESHAERLQLLDDLLIDVTQFFRDRRAFNIIENEVAPRLVSEAAAQNRSVRLWIAGCSSGEEAYSIAMVFMEAAERLGATTPPVQVFATDVHPGVIERAGAGRYTDDEISGVPHSLREKYFVRGTSDWQVTPRLRTAITFATHNLLTDAPFTRIDFASCRNLLIYFKSPAQERAIGSLSFSLRLGGVLFLGSSETLGHAEGDFIAINSSWRVFSKETESRDRMFRASGSPTPTQVPTRTPIVAADHSLLRSYDAVLESVFAGALLISHRRELVHVMGDASDWLTQPSGRPTLDVLSLLRDPTMRLAVGAVLRELDAGATEATPRQLGAPEAGASSVEALMGRRIEMGSGRYMSLVHTRTAERPLQLQHPTPGMSEDVDLDQLDHLEAELAYTRESLQAALEEQETSNEELNAANEELIASNEELQSTNEELSSVNEELRTLNDEHQRRLDQVLDLTADLEELMSATEIGVVFLAEDGTIRRFNEPARDFFRVRDQDLGRAFEDVRSVFDGDVIAEGVRSAFISRQSSSRAMITQGPESRRVAVRISPYQLPRERSGVLVAVVDITDLEVADEERLLARFLKTVPAAMNAVIYDHHCRFTYRLRPFNIDGNEVDPVGMRPGEFMPMTTARQITDVHAQVLESGQPQYRVDQGEFGPYEGSPVFRVAFPIEMEGEDGVGALTLDATSFEPLVRMQRDQAILDSVLRGARGTLILIDPDLTVVAVEGVETGTPLPSAESIASWIELDSEAHLEAVHAAMSGSTTVATGRRSEDGRWQLLAYLPFNQTSTTARAAVLVRDHHDQTVVEREHIDRIARLEQELRELQNSSAADVATLAERNEDLDNFAHVAAHDLKAPIRSIRSFGELALDALSDPKEAKQHVEQVVASAKRMGALVDSLLEFAAIDRGTVEAQEIDLRDLIDDVQLDLRSEISETDAEITIELDRTRIGGSPDGIRQVITNLVHNAIKFRGAERPIVSITTRNEDGGVLIAVEDNGRGFDVGQADRLFEPFQRLHAEPTPGSGVGLAICQRIVQRHNGRIWASTDPDTGSRFSIWLPSESELE